MPKATLENNQKHAIAYIVKSWPRLSETFVLNEILSLEQRGVRIRIFSVKEPDPGPSHPKVAQVRAEVTYLALWPHWKKALPANLRSFRRQPGRYRSEEHTSELQSLAYLVCRLLLEKKKKKKST